MMPSRKATEYRRRFDLDVSDSQLVEDLQEEQRLDLPSPPNSACMSTVLYLRPKA